MLPPSGTGKTCGLSTGPASAATARDYDDLHDLVERLSPRQAEPLRVLVASDPELASAAEPEGQDAARRHLSISGIGESGRGDLAERHDEILRGRLKRPA